MFRLSKKADEWTKDIVGESPFDLKLDIYYLFLLVGLTAKKSSAFTDFGKDINNSFPDGFKQQQKLIINFLLISRKKLLAIPDDDKQRIRSELLEKYIDPETNSLTLEGRNLSNEYANAGFEILENLMASPKDASAFLHTCLEKIKELEKKF